MTWVQESTTWWIRCIFGIIVGMTSSTRFCNVAWEKELSFQLSSRRIIPSLFYHAHQTLFVSCKKWWFNFNLEYPLFGKKSWKARLALECFFLFQRKLFSSFSFHCLLCCILFRKKNDETYERRKQRAVLDNYFVYWCSSFIESS